MVTEVTQFSGTEPRKNARLPDWFAEGSQPCIELRGPKENAPPAVYPFGYNPSSVNRVRAA